MCAAGGAAGAGAGAAAIAQATRASGVLIALEPDEFQRLLNRMKDPLIVTAEGGLFSTTYRYMTSHKGLAFHTKTSVPLHLPRPAETVSAKRMWIP